MSAVPVGAGTFGAGSVTATLQTLTMVAPAGAAIGDFYIAQLTNKSVTPNPVTADAGNPASGQTTFFEDVLDATSSADDLQGSLVYGRVMTGGAQTYTFNKANNDAVGFGLSMGFFRDVSTSLPLDPTSPGVTKEVAAVQLVSFAAFDPFLLDVLMLYFSWYSDDQTTFAAAMSADTNPDCTILYDNESNVGSDFSMSLTTGHNDGSPVAARTWDSAATAASGWMSIVLALVTAGAEGAGPRRHAYFQLHQRKM